MEDFVTASPLSVWPSWPWRWFGQRLGQNLTKTLQKKKREAIYFLPSWRRLEDIITNNSFAKTNSTNTGLNTFPRIFVYMYQCVLYLFPSYLYVQSQKSQTHWNSISVSQSNHYESFWLIIIIIIIFQLWRRSDFVTRVFFSPVSALQPAWQKAEQNVLL